MEIQENKRKKANCLKLYVVYKVKWLQNIVSLEYWNTQKSVWTIWQHFSRLLDEGISKFYLITSFKILQMTNCLPASTSIPRHTYIASGLKSWEKCYKATFRPVSLFGCCLPFSCTDTSAANKLLNIENECDKLAKKTWYRCVVE